MHIISNLTNSYFYERFIIFLQNRELLKIKYYKTQISSFFLYLKKRIKNFYWCVYNWFFRFSRFYVFLSCLYKIYFFNWIKKNKFYFKMTCLVLWFKLHQYFLNSNISLNKYFEYFSVIYCKQNFLLIV